MTAGHGVGWTPQARLRLAEILRVIRNDAGGEVAAKWGDNLLHAVAVGGGDIRPILVGQIRLADFGVNPL